MNNQERDEAIAKLTARVEALESVPAEVNAETETASVAETTEPAKTEA